MQIYGICDSYFGSSLSAKDNRIDARDRFIKMSQRRRDSFSNYFPAQDVQDTEHTKGQSHGQPLDSLGPGCRLTVRNVECLSKQVNRIKIEPLLLQGSRAQNKTHRGGCPHPSRIHPSRQGRRSLIPSRKYKSYISHYKLLSYQPYLLQTNNLSC